MPFLVIYKNAPAIAKLARTMNFKPHCKNAINNAYVDKAITSADYIVAALGKKDSKLLGFACVKVRPSSVYVSTLCSSARQGRACMQQVEAFARVMGRDEVTLEALHAVVGFYQHIGYRRTSAASSTSADAPVPMHKRLTQATVL